LRFPYAKHGNGKTRRGIVVARKILPKGHIVTRQNSIVTRQNSIATRQNSMATQQNSIATQQNSIATQQNSMATQQNSMATQQNSIAPLSAFMTTRRRHLAAVLMLALFYVTQNIGGVFFQARGVPAGHTALSLLGFLTGVLVGALVFDALDKRLERKPNGSGVRALHACLLAALLLPGLFCLTSFLIVPYSANQVLNTVQPFLWGSTLPVVMCLFFRHAEQGGQSLYFGIGVGMGCLAWALLMPLVLSFSDGSVIAEAPGASGAATLTEPLQNRFLPFLNVSRVLSNWAFAVLAWQLVRRAPQRFSEPDGPRELGDAARPSGGGRILRLLLPLILCFAVSGMLGYLSFSRMVLRGAYSEYLHLGLAALFPLCGLLLYRHGQGLLRPFLCLAVLCFTAAVLLPRPNSPPGLVQGVFIVCAAGHQALFFFGVMAFSRFAQQSRHPALTLSLPFLAAFAAVPGNLLASRLLPALGLSPYPALWILAGLCLLSLFALHRSFPLPEAPGAAETAESDAALAAAHSDAAARSEALRLEALRQESESKRRAFAAAFDLTASEEKLLDGLLEGENNETLAVRLEVRERTVRYHLGGLLKKTGQTNRQRLIHFYTDWRR
jgi:DNA-binding CsgD family transcriptional regulator